MKTAEKITIIAARPCDIEQVRELFQEYAASLNFPLCFQNFEQEVATLPGKYSPPQGTLLLAFCGGDIAGCGALRSLDENVCEMKRLYVRPSFRCHGIGRIVAERLIDKAKRIGYALIRLDTVPAQMQGANRLYHLLGFYEIPAYYHNPQPGTVYMELRLK
jgi:GNAT superfamily N-acetyltransferase